MITTKGRTMKRFSARLAALFVPLIAGLGIMGAGPAGAASQVNGAGSTTGLGLYANNQIQFAGTEAEYASLPQQDPARGHQYIPDVAGATAIMYNIKDASGKKVDYLHLDTKTVARIFTGKIVNWSDPAISATNKGIKFPAGPIRHHGPVL
jgi:phosphate transport system substrate-binding protein